MADTNDTTEQPTETPGLFLVETIARERQQWLDDLHKHYMDRLADIDEVEEHLRALRADRDATARAIREMTPRKRRGAVDTGGGNG
jgi:hypothetical protein